MRFSTLGIVAASFAIGVFGYASAFSTTSTQYQAAGPAAWPTLVDSRNIIQMGPRLRLRKLSQEIKERQVSLPVDEAKPESEAPPPARRRVASLGRVPLVPNLSTKNSSPKRANLRPPPPLPVLARKNLVLALDWSAFRKVLKQNRKLAIVLPERKVSPARGQPRRAQPRRAQPRRVLRDERPLRLASTAKARPHFDTFTRSSLGGPKPADLLVEDNAPTVVSPPALVKQVDRSELPRSTAAVRETEKLAASRSTHRAQQRLASLDPKEEALPPLAEPLQIPVAADDGAERARQRRLAAVAVRRSRAIDNRRARQARQARQARRKAQRRRAKNRRRHARASRNARGSRHAKRRRSGKYRRFQAWRNRKIANELRLRRRIRGIY
jgi:hypothetical protein